MAIVLSFVVCVSALTCDDVFSRIFGEMPPARTTVQAHLADPTMLVEIEAIAFVGES